MRIGFKLQTVDTVWVQRQIFGKRCKCLTVLFGSYKTDGLGIIFRRHTLEKSKPLPHPDRANDRTHLERADHRSHLFL